MSQTVLLSVASVQSFTKHLPGSFYWSWKLD